MQQNSEIIIYQTADNETRIQTRLQDETVWLNRHQISTLFDRNIKTIGKHINNIFEEGELNKEVVVAKFATTTQHGAIKGKTQTKKLIINMNNNFIANNQTNVKY